MKIQKEVVLPDPGQSFKLFKPSLKNFFFWHYHPEYELVYVEATTGIRHVGQHISSFMDSDLVLIGGFNVLLQHLLSNIKFYRAHFYFSISSLYSLPLRCNF